MWPFSNCDNKSERYDEFKNSPTGKEKLAMIRRDDGAGWGNGAVFTAMADYLQELEARIEKLEGKT